jgi:Fe2+ transport system protein FeoA
MLPGCFPGGEKPVGLGVFVDGPGANAGWAGLDMSQARKGLVLASSSHLIYFSADMSSRTRPPQSPLPGCHHPAVCPLNKIRAGMAARIKELSAPPEVSHRLRELGFCEDQQIRLLSCEDNIICQVCNVRLGISEQLAESILVEPMPLSAP